MKSRNKLKAIIIILGIVIISWTIVYCLKLTDVKILQEDFLFTYLGVFLGFALTIYTFGISMLETIKTAIENTDEEILTKVKKKEFFNSIISGFNELKSNILFITFSFLIIVFLTLIKNIKYPDSFQILFDRIKLYYPLETIYLAVFLISILIIFDLLYSMFNIAEISLFIIKKKINKTNT
jgi:hypothetical protein